MRKIIALCFLLATNSLHSNPLIPLHYKRAHIINSIYHLINNTVYAVAANTIQTNSVYMAAATAAINAASAGTKVITGDFAGAAKALSHNQEIIEDIQEHTAEYLDACALIAGQAYVNYYIDKLIPIPNCPDTLPQQGTHLLAQVISNGAVQTTISNFNRQPGIFSAVYLAAALAAKYETPSFVDTYVLRLPHHTHSTQEKKLTFMQQVAPQFIANALA